MPNPQSRNNRRDSQDPTLIIPHITKEMLDVARSMAERGASRAEIEQAIAAMQQSMPQQPAPAKPEPQPKAHRPTFLPTRRPRYSEEQRKAMLEQMQRQQTGFPTPAQTPETPQTPKPTAARPQQTPVQPPHHAEVRPTASAKAAPAKTTPARTTAARPTVAKASAKPSTPPAAQPVTRQIRKAAPQASAAPRTEAPTQVLPKIQKTQPEPKAQSAAKTQPIPKVQPAPTPAPIPPQQQQERPQPAPAQPAQNRPNAVPRSRSEAEADLDERIRSDHIWLSNPVLVRGLGLAPIVGAALDGHRALMLCLASLILVTFTHVLAVAVCHLTQNKFRPVIYCYSAALIYIPTYILLYQLFGTDLTLLGIYLPILTVEPAIVKRMDFTELESVSEALRHGFNNALGMCVALLLVGCLRELLAAGTIFGQTILRTPPLPLAALPAGGFVLVGLLAAFWCAIANLYTDYKHEEVRRLYANRKH